MHPKTPLPPPSPTKVDELRILLRVAAHRERQLRDDRLGRMRERMAVVMAEPLLTQELERRR